MPGFWDSVEDFFTTPLVSFLYNESKYTIARGSARKLAEKYGLRPNNDNDLKSFRKLWNLTAVANKYSEKYHSFAVQEVIELVRLLGKVEESVSSLRPQHRNTFKLSDRYSNIESSYRIHRTDYPLGLDNVRFGNVRRNKYVIFSDLHMLYPGNRQQFFDRVCNKELYLAALSDYYGPNDFNLVDNGDVEELLVLEPEPDEIKGIGRWSWKKVFEYRESKKIPQLEAIVSANRDYYRAVCDFHSEGRYFKLTGNHDYDMARSQFRDVVEGIINRSFPLADDVLALGEGSRTDYLICHGHQFDTACTPAFAKMLGESFSQSQSWCFEGPDRTWKWGHKDFPEQKDPIWGWLDGSIPLSNDLVSDEADLGALQYLGISDFSEIWFALGDAVADSGLSWGVSDSGWEHMQGKNIAWEYFYNPDDPTREISAQYAVDSQVRTGQRWFKYRHMNEKRIVKTLNRINWQSSDPTLILGHSHEARLDSGGGKDGLVGNYINTAAAGRHENLVWAAEIENGRSRIVSWHFRDGPSGRGPMVKTTWKSMPHPTKRGKQIIHPDRRETVLSRRRLYAAATLITQGP